MNLRRNVSMRQTKVITVLKDATPLPAGLLYDDGPKVLMVGKEGNGEW